MEWKVHLYTMFCNPNIQARRRCYCAGNTRSRASVAERVAGFGDKRCADWANQADSKEVLSVVFLISEGSVKTAH